MELLPPRRVRARDTRTTPNSGIRPRRRVLLIEDDAAARETLRELLEALGYLVIAVGSAADALRINGAPDAIVSDIGLPDGCGFELARRLRSQPGWAEVPVIGMSGSDGMDRLRLAEQEGFLRYLTKPLSIQDLHTTLSGVLRHPR